MNMELIQNTATEVLVNLLLGVVTLAGAYGIYYIRLGAAKLKEQTARIRDASARKLLEDAVVDVTGLAMLSVSAAEQTTAKALREAVRNGTGNREDLLALGKQVFDEVKEAVTPEVQERITANLGSFDAYLTKCIEDAVLKVKQDGGLTELPQIRYSGSTRETVREAAPSGTGGTGRNVWT